MLELRGLSLARGGAALLDDVTLTLFAGQRVGITGANGSGKSSLFALLLDELQPDRGELKRPPSWVVAHVAQETPASDRAALDYVLDGDAELRRVQRELAAVERRDGASVAAACERAADGARLAELHARLDAIGGYDAPARAGRLLAGLGFGAADQQRPVSDFSGGWRMRLNLAQALMCRSDLLLLDEPTNHLDLDAVLWLERWLSAYPGTLLLVSHDRDFLDAVVGHVVHLHDRRLTLYAGNYSAFETQRAARLAQQQAAYDKQQREIAHLRRFIDRFRAKASKARQAQSRVKALAKLETIALAHVDSPFRFRFRAPDKLPSPLLTLNAAAAGYAAARPVLSGLTLSLQPGQRLGLLGPNGAGKSTLIKLLAGALAPLAGERVAADGLRVGYFAQHQLEQLRPERSPLQHLQTLDPGAGEQALRDFLGGFGFGGTRADRDVAPFSGGEKARLALALLVWRGPNLLLLDEPTNHLDLDMRHALNVALQEYDGALIVVSHDRHLLRTATDELWLVSGGRAQRFDGDLDDYRDARYRDDAGAPSRARAAAGGGEARRERRRRDAEQRAKLAALQKPLKSELARLDRRLETLNEEKHRLEAELADPALYQDDADKPRLQRLLVRQGEAGRELDALETRWFELHEQLDALAAGAGPPRRGGR